MIKDSKRDGLLSGWVVCCGKVLVGSQAKRENRKGSTFRIVLCHHYAGLDCEIEQ